MYAEIPAAETITRPPTREQLIDYIREGVTLAEVGRRHGCDRRHVSRLVDQYKLRAFLGVMRAMEPEVVAKPRPAKPKADPKPKQQPKPQEDKDAEGPLRRFGDTHPGWLISDDAMASMFGERRFPSYKIKRHPSRTFIPSS